jgi:hypothetical protein
LPLFANQLTDLNINYIATDTLFFDIETYSERKLFITLDSGSVDLAENFRITSDILVEPDSAVFRGPLSLVNQLPEVFLVSLSENKINREYNEELSLDLFSPSLIKKFPEVIHVQFDVEEYIDQDAQLNIELVNFPYDSSVYIQNSLVDAAFKIRKSFRNRMKKEDFLVIADMNNMHSDSTITIEVMDLPRYVSDISFTQNRVKVIYAN